MGFIGDPTGNLARCNSAHVEIRGLSLQNGAENAIVDFTPMSQPPISQKQIAEALGITQATVSMALAGNPKITLKLNGIKPEDIGVEMLVISKRKTPTEPFSVLKCTPLAGVMSGEDEGTWSGVVQMQKPGVYEYGFRIFPKHAWLAHRQDFSLMKWV